MFPPKNDRPTWFYFENRDRKTLMVSWRTLLLVVVTLERVGEKRSKCARRRRGREDSECANRQPGTSAAAAEHLPDPDLPCLHQLPILCARLWLRFHCRLKCSEASVNHHLPPHTFSGARLFLAQLRESVLPALLLFIPVS